jgi:hypothetical protein
MMRFVQYLFVAIVLIVLTPMMVVVLLSGHRTPRQMYVDVKASVRDSLELSI